MVFGHVIIDSIHASCFCEEQMISFSFLRICLLIFLTILCFVCRKTKDPSIFRWIWGVILLESLNLLDLACFNTRWRAFFFVSSNLLQSSAMVCFFLSKITQKGNSFVMEHRIDLGFILCYFCSFASFIAFINLYFIIVYLESTRPCLSKAKPYLSILQRLRPEQNFIVLKRN